jgi:arylsulfatase A-like enzyme
LALLKAAGVRTVLVRATREAHDAPAEFYAGWGDLFDARPDPADASPTDALLRTLPDVLDRLAETPRWLMWIELDRLVPPWTVSQEVFDAYVEDLLEEAEPGAESVPPWTDPPIGWFDANDLASWELLHRTVAAVVTVFDAELGEVFDLLRARGLDRTAAWVFTADHGLPLGEHGIIGLFRPWLHEELVHLPLIIRLPDAAEAGRRVAALTQPADLMPTLAGWFGASVPGPSLEPLLHGQAETLRANARTGLELDGAAEWAIRTPDWAYLLPVRPHPDDEPREPMLFEKPDDRWEVNNLHSRHVELSEELEQRLRQPADDASGTPQGAGWAP